MVGTSRYLSRFENVSKNFLSLNQLKVMKKIWVMVINTMKGLEFVLNIFKGWILTSYCIVFFLV